MIELFIDMIKLLVQFIMEDVPLIYLCFLIALPFLFLASEFSIRKVMNLPFKSKKEIVQTLGYLTIGIVIFLTMFQLIINLPFLSLQWSVEEKWFLGLLILFLIAVLSPFTSFYVYMKSKILQILYLLIHSSIFIYVIDWISGFKFQSLHIPVYLYGAIGLFYLFLVMLITKGELDNEGVMEGERES